MSAIAAAPTRRYPNVVSSAPPRLPISLVTVHYSDEFVHNIAVSECVRDPLNDVIVVDNRGGIFFDNLSQAISSGVARARNDLVAVVHEDVLLPPGWQATLEASLAALERHDPEWGVLGSVGWRADGGLLGHWSDPHGYFDLLGRPFAEIHRLDEQLLVLRRSRGLALDPALPSIHNIGRDLPLSALARGLKTYVINAPTIHKYADAAGRLIQKPEDSPKIRARSSLTWLAEKAHSDSYFHAKWPSEPGAGGSRFDVGAQGCLPASAPIVLLCRGGGGSRLLSTLARQAGIFIGQDVNASGDSMEMVLPLYRAVFAKYRGGASRSHITHLLRAGAHEMLERAGFPPRWGFKLPESVLLTEEIAEAFPNARFAHLIRDPLTTCLRRTHMTARLDNEVGRAVLPAAYRHLGLDLGAILCDSPARRMAVTTRHQLETVLAFGRGLPRSRYLELRFESLLADPRRVEAMFERWLDHGPAEARRRLTRRLRGGGGGPSMLARETDRGRAANPSVVYPREIAREVAEALAPLRQRLGYLD